MTQSRENRQVQKGSNRRRKGYRLDAEGSGEPLKVFELFTEGPGQICVWEDR